MMWIIKDLIFGGKGAFNMPAGNPNPGKVAPKAAPYRNKVKCPHTNELPEQVSIGELYGRYKTRSSSKLKPKAWSKSRLDR